MALQPPPSLIQENESHWAHEFQSFGTTQVSQMNWNQEFEQFHPPQGLLDEHQAFETAFSKIQINAEDWKEEFTRNENLWIQEFDKHQSSHNCIHIDSDSHSDALSKTAGLVVASVEKLEKFKNSQFLDFMRQLRDKQVSIENHKLVHSIAPVSDPSPVAQATDWANQFNSHLEWSSWEEKFDLESPGSFAPQQPLNSNLNYTLNQSSSSMQWNSMNPMHSLNPMNLMNSQFKNQSDFYNANETEWSREFKLASESIQNREKREKQETNQVEKEESVQELSNEMEKAFYDFYGIHFYS